MKKIKSNSVDSIITDPPYGLTQNKKGGSGEASLNLKHPGGRSRITTGGGFMGQKWDAGIPGIEYWKEMLRVAKPGAILLSFGGTRTFHRLACLIEDAGWELRDCLCWLYGSGFPKSLDIGKAIDQAGGQSPKEQAMKLKRVRESSGLTRQELAHKVGCTEASIRDWEEGRSRAKGRNIEWIIPSNTYRKRLQMVLEYSSDVRTRQSGNIDRRGDKTVYGLGHTGEKIIGGNSSNSQLWNGWGSALKPAYEPIIVAMKPLDGTFAQNALKWGVAGLNIDGCRIPTKDNLNGGGYSSGESKGMWTPGKDGGGFRRLPGEFVQPPGRWPANLVLDGEAAKLLDEQAGTKKSGARKADTVKKSGSVNCYGKDNRTGKQVYPEDVPASEGGPSRFFYTAKPSRRERGEFNNHPTVKSIALMKYLCLLTKTPTGGVVLDPFMGSGTTGLACLATGRKFVGIEKEKAYFKIARRRIQEKIKS